MKLFFIVFLFPFFSFSSVSLDQDFDKARFEIEAQVKDKDSRLNQMVGQLVSIHNLPQSSVLTLPGKDLLFKGNSQSFYECKESCVAYERKFYRQFSDIRFKKGNGKVQEIQLWPVNVYLYILRVWESDESGNKNKLLSEEIEVTNVVFL